MPLIFSYLIRGLAQLWPLGLFPKAPGTITSAAATVAAIFLFLPLSLGWRLFVLAVIFVVGSLAAGRAEKDIGQKDPRSLVIDELFGQWLVFLPINTLIARPGFPDQNDNGLLIMFLAFVLFRVFDISKPWLVRKAENLPGGWGIMMDDLVAGLFALISLLLIMIAFSL